jgi:hypothetical protein
MSYFPSISQNVIVDSTNRVSNYTLAASAIWNSAGVGTSTLGVNGIQIVISAVQNMLVFVDQGSAESTFEVTDEYDYTASVGNFGITVQAVGAFVRVRVQNTSSVTDTALNVFTVLCPIVEALPRSLDDAGHLKVGVKCMEDGYGFEVENTPTGELRVVTPVRLIGSTFEGTTIDPQFWTVASTAAPASATVANAQLAIASGTANLATVTAFSTRRARYIGGASMRYRAVVRADAGTANNTRKWGVGWGASMPTVTDGAFFQLSGTTFSIVTVKGGTPTAIDSGAFNGVLGSVFSPVTTVATYEIYWTNSKVWFVIGDKILHTVSAASTTWSNTMHFHGFMSSVNTGIASNVILNVRTATIYRLGNFISAPQSYFHANGQSAGGVQLKGGLGSVHRITLQSSNNSVVTLADSTSAATPVLWATTGAASIMQPVSIDVGGMQFFNGLRLYVTSGNSQVTVIYE